jgi:hypothetical protein
LTYLISSLSSIVNRLDINDIATMPMWHRRRQVTLQRATTKYGIFLSGLSCRKG